MNNTDRLRLLIISQELPYASVAHAGGQTLFYYLNRLAKDIDITLISFCDTKEIQFISELERVGLSNLAVVPINKNLHGLNMLPKIERTINYFRMPDSSIFHYPRYWAIMAKEIRLLWETGKTFDVIQFEWTSSLAFLSVCERYFMSSAFVASLHDFNSVAIDRRLKLEQRAWKRYLFDRQKKFEVSKLKKCNTILVHSPADIDRVSAAGIDRDKIVWLCPYYHDLKGCALNRVRNSDDTLKLLFFGAMWREENSKSIIEFIKNVLFPLRNEGYDIKLTIMGSGPTAELLKLNNSESVEVLGYVNDISSVFGCADAFIAPLVLGGGIKVKVLEAMSAGLPVITNKIGIEGIEAKANKEYIHVENWDEWRQVIRNIYYNREILHRIGRASPDFLHRNFDLNTSYIRLLNTYNKLTVGDKH